MRIEEKHRTTIGVIYYYGSRLLEVDTRRQEGKYRIIKVLEVCIRQRVVQSLRSGEKRERASWLKRGNVFNTFNQLFHMQNRQLFPFLSIITLIDPNQIGGSRGDTGTARFELHRCILKLSLYSVNTVLILYRTDNSRFSITVGALVLSDETRTVLSLQRVQRCV